MPTGPQQMCVDWLALINMKYLFELVRLQVLIKMVKAMIQTYA